MALYSQVTLQQFVDQVGDLLDDPLSVYWTTQEKVYATWEALRVWGAYTDYWRTRGSFTVGPSTPYYNMAQLLPSLRTRTYTLDQMVREIQYMLLENPGGISGVGMSGQVRVTDILYAIRDARNRFVIDSHIPYTYHQTIASAFPPDGMVAFSQSSVYVHRAGWIDATTGYANNLWRQDTWAMDKGDYLWPETPSTPLVYSEAENAPLRLQLAPPPANSGTLEALTVDSLYIDITDPNATFDVPDEWVHAIKYASLSQILSSEGQIKDPLRAQYAEQRYQQALQLAQNAGSIIRLQLGNRPLNIDTLAAVDAGIYSWRNNYGAPLLGATVYDFLIMIPGVLDRQYGIAADVCQTAPLPALNEFMPVGEEEMDGMKDYVSHILSFKCGGTDFTTNYSGLDSYMSNVAQRKKINAAKINYLTASFQQAQKEDGERPDKKAS